jgi:hypothetical protein
MGLDRLVENGDEVNYAWLLAVNGQAQNTNETWQLAFCHGIGGQYSGKCPQYFARIAFVDKPDGLEIKPDEIPGMSEEDKEFGLYEVIDFSDPAVVDTFTGENASVEYITEGEESFMRVTSLAIDGQYPMAYSSKYPKNVLGGTTDYVVVKYRTSYENAEDLGVIFRTVNLKEYDVDNCYYEVIGGDGEWHTVIFYMEDFDAWNHYILNIGFVPFVYDENSAQAAIDIAWMKVYQQDPYDLYYESEYDPDGTPDNDETTAAEDGETSAPEGEDTPAPEGTTAAPDGNTTEDPSVTEPAKGGCSSSVAFGLAALLSAMAAAVVLKKKD